MPASTARTARVDRRPLLALCLAALPILTGGCETAPTVKHDDVLRDYEQGRYTQAYAGATQLSDASTGDAKTRAEYLAGLSAYRLGKDADAIAHLNRVKGSADKSIAGPANATIGLSQSRQGRHEQAVVAFENAAKLMDGNDQAQAYFHLGTAEQKLGRWTSARTHLSLAVSKATDPNLKAAARQRLDNTGFTLQFGAFGARVNADQRAREVYRQCESAGIGAPRIATSKAPDGKTLFLVQAGRFSTYSSALASRTKLGRNDVIVTQIEN